MAEAKPIFQNFFPFTFHVTHHVVTLLHILFGLPISCTRWLFLLLWDCYDMSWLIFLQVLGLHFSLFSHTCHSLELDEFQKNVFVLANIFKYFLLFAVVDRLLPFVTFLFFFRPCHPLFSHGNNCSCNKNSRWWVLRDVYYLFISRRFSFNVY